MLDAFEHLLRDSIFHRCVARSWHPLCVCELCDVIVNIVTFVMKRRDLTVVAIIAMFSAGIGNLNGITYRIRQQGLQDPQIVSEKPLVPSHVRGC